MIKNATKQNKKKGCITFGSASLIMVGTGISSSTLSLIDLAALNT